MHIEHISVSRAGTYKECAQKYKFHYHLKTPSPVEEPFYFSYGKIVHKIAEEYIKNRGEKSLNELWIDVKSGNLEIEENVKAPILPKEYEKRLPIHLKQIQNLTSKLGFDGLVEHNFLYDLDPPNKKCVKGFIDRLFFKGDMAFIVDYKTTKKGNWRVTKESVKYDLQLRTYTFIVMEEFKYPPEKIVSALFYLEDGEMITGHYNLKDLMNAKKELLDLYNQIHEHDVDNVRGNIGNHCCRCIYESICPFRSSSKNISWDGDMSKLSSIW